MDKKYVCPCGLNCYDCLFHKEEIYETAIKLKQLIKDSQFDVFLSILSKKDRYDAIAKHLSADESNFEKVFQSFKDLPFFFNVLDNLIKIQCKNTCQETGGCSMTGTKHECEAVKCVKQKGYAGCWECSENGNCTLLAFQKQSYGKTIDENFNTINEQGIEAIKSRGNLYYEWQRKIANKH